jgi:glycosyltransferase involved in cell wall biosynthesis
MVFQTEGARSFYPKLNKHVRIIPNPVLVEKDIPSVPPQFRRSCIVSVGRLQRRKGFDVLIDAFARVHRELPEYKLYIYGEGEERLALEAQIAAAGLQEAVFLPGIAIQILKKNRDIKLFVMPSRSEGIPNVLIEAMSEGIPCVSADCSPGGARLLLGDSYGGLLVPPDNADAMAEAMLKMLMNNEMAEQFAQRAQKSLSRFAVENIAEIWLSFFREILEEKTDGSFHKTCH